MEKQVYLAVGTLLPGASTMNLDSCPIEGFDSKLLGSALNLHEWGLIGSVIVALGRKSADEPNSRLPKSRLPMNEIITRI